MKIQRILVALDASPHSLAALEAAIDLAERLDAELQGLFIEDINLLRLAQLPFARELRYPLPGSQKVDTLHMEEQLRGQAAQAQRLLQQLAEERKIKHSFTVVRGVVASSLLQATLESDLLVLGRTSHTLIRTGRLGSTAQTAVTHAERSVLLVHPKADLSRPPLLIYDGSTAAERVLSVATSITPRNGRLYILLYLPDIDTAQNAIDHIETALTERQIEAVYRRLYGVQAQDLIDFINESENSLLILSDQYKQFSSALIRHLAEDLTCPVLVVR
ncbi:MAG: universal stress protein [Chloroflexi bacterium]|nr:universal stress protein [Chloroflexota bacterium]MBP7041872.1 universal stress protein [Chloroflexota bacterium]